MEVASELEAEGLCKAFGPTVALDGVDLRIVPGEVVGLLGRNGAGKTTLASVIAGLVEPDAGTLTIGGVDARRHPRRARRSLGFAPQTTGVYETLTVEQNLRFFAELVGLRGRSLGGRLEKVCQMLLLEPLRAQRCQTLSGGEKRRLHTAIALLGRPRLLLLDEPTVGADVVTRVALLGAVKALAREGSAVLYTSHYLPEVEEIADSVTIVDAGRVVARGGLEELTRTFGRSGIELTFDGAAPGVGLETWAVEYAGSTLRLETTTPAEVMPLVLQALGPDADRLRAVNFIQPDLESVFLALTGERFDTEEGNRAAA